MNKDVIHACEEPAVHQPDYEEFMASVFFDLRPGAFVGSLRGIAPGDRELSVQEYLDTIESDWNNYAPCASYFQHEAEEPEDEQDLQQLIQERERLTAAIEKLKALEASSDECRAALEHDEGLVDLGDDDDDTSIFSHSGKGFAGLHFVLIYYSLDDEVLFDALGDDELSSKLEVAPGVYEIILLLDEPITDFEKASALIEATEKAGHCIREGDGPWAFARRPPAKRLAGPQVLVPEEDAFLPRFVVWQPEVRYKVEELVRRLGLEHI